MPEYLFEDLPSLFTALGDAAASMTDESQAELRALLVAAAKAIGNLPVEVLIGRSDEPELFPMAPSERPKCPECAKDMILVAVPADTALMGWMCDCMYLTLPAFFKSEELIESIKKTRETKDGFLTYNPRGQFDAMGPTNGSVH